MMSVAYMGMDVHAGTTVLGAMNSLGEFVGNQRFDTSEKGIVQALARFPAKAKYLALEESTLAHWVAQVAKPHVSEVLICDPRHNALIYGGALKRDPVDTEKLCRLLRLGELKEVYHPQEDHRAIFKAAVQHYLDLRDQQVVLKLKIKAMYRHWGVVRIPGEAVYRKEGRTEYLKQIKASVVQSELKRLYAILDQTEEMEALAAREMKRLGRRYPEIKQFKKIPGIGPVGAITFPTSTRCGATASWASSITAATGSHWASNGWTARASVNSKRSVIGRGSTRRGRTTRCGSSTTLRCSGPIARSMPGLTRNVKSLP
jgi:hypothetical protein